MIYNAWNVIVQGMGHSYKNMHRFGGVHIVLTNMDIETD